MMRAVYWLCALGLGACAAAPSDPGPAAGGRPAAASAPSLAGTRWIGAEDKAADHRTLPRLEFVREGRLAGYTGCNMLSGVWKMDGDAVRVGALVMTKRMCAGPEGDTEKRVLAALAQGSRGVREGGRLVFTAPGGAQYSFSEAAAT